MGAKEETATPTCNSFNPSSFNSEEIKVLLPFCRAQPATLRLPLLRDRLRIKPISVLTLHGQNCLSTPEGIPAINRSDSEFWRNLFRLHLEKYPPEKVTQRGRHLRSNDPIYFLPWLSTVDSQEPQWSTHPDTAQSPLVSRSSKRPW